MGVRGGASMRMGAALLGFQSVSFLDGIGPLCGLRSRLGSDRVSGVIDLRDAADFKMNLIMKDFDQHLLAHHSGHVHLELGTTTSSDSSRR